ncbi:MAG: MAPEG family protein [Leptolyngbyaceae cyanobacterium bins.349]|nr:MAPEG family protein [Leptolyngbyaceae cyanobacterium bins.349]
MTLPALPFPTPVVLLYSIAIAAVLIYLPFLLVAYGRLQIGLEALEKPRALVDKLPGFAQRANAAHQNAFETFIVFSVAALMGYVTGLASTSAAWAAIAFVVARLLYPIFYIANIPLARSLMFGIGTISTATLFVQSLMQVTR